MEMGVSQNSQGINVSSSKSSKWDKECPLFPTVPFRRTLELELDGSLLSGILDSAPRPVEARLAVNFF